MITNMISELYDSNPTLLLFSTSQFVVLQPEIWTFLYEDSILKVSEYQVYYQSFFDIHGYFLIILSTRRNMLNALFNCYVNTSIILLCHCLHIRFWLHNASKKKATIRLFVDFSGRNNFPEKSCLISSLVTSEKNRCNSFTYCVRRSSCNEVK